MYQLFTNTNLNRDPRGWTVSIAYLGFINSDIPMKDGDDAKDVRWFPVNQLPELAFDHHLFLDGALKHIKERIIFMAFGQELLAQTFQLQDLSTLYSAVMEDNDKVEAIIARLAANNIIVKTGDKYQFEQAAYNRVLANGFFNKL